MWRRHGLDDSPEISALLYSQAYADWNAQKSPKFGDKDAQRRNCGTLAVYRPSSFDLASKIAGMAEIGVGDRPGPPAHLVM